MKPVFNPLTGKWEFTIFNVVKQFDSEEVAVAELQKELNFWFDDPYDYL